MDRRAQIVGIVLIVVGVLILLARGLDLDFGIVGWPLFVLVPGVLMLVAAFLSGGEASGLAVPGSIVTTVGAILFLQSVTGRFETWSYAWGLVLASVGVGSFLQGALDGDDEEGNSGLQLIVLGLTLFAVFGIFFEFLVFGASAGSAWGRFLVPALLIVAGAILLGRRDRATGDRDG